MTDTVGKTPPSRLWRGVLVASLALNLLVVGLVLGAVMRPDGKFHAKGMHRAELRGFGTPFIRSLPREVKASLFIALRDAGHLPDKAARNVAFAQMIDVLRAQPFDREVTQTALRQQAALVLETQARAQDEWLRQVGLMSDEMRLAYADRLEERMERRKKKDR